MAATCSQNGPETNESGCLGPGLGPGPPWGPMPTHTLWCPGFGPDEFRWPLRTTICMAKEMWFLRLLLEWPGFPTLSCSVIQCTAAVPLPGTWFLQESLFWENIIYFANIPYFLKTIRRIPMGFIGFSLKNHAKAYVSLPAARTRPPTTYLLTTTESSITHRICGPEFFLQRGNTTSSRIV